MQYAMYFRFVDNVISCSQDQQWQDEEQDQDQLSQDQDQDRQIKRKQIHIAHSNSQSFMNVVNNHHKSVIYCSSQSALNLMKFMKIAVFVIKLRKMDYNFTTHTC